VLKYAFRRLVYAVPMVFAVATVGFFVIHLVPGNPARAVLGIRATPAAVAAMDHRLGLDQPLTVQYWHFLRGAVALNFGTSTEYNLSVSSLLGTRIGPTVLVIGYGMAVAILIAVPLAVLAAVHHDRVTDHAIRLGGMVTFVMPPFWLGLLLSLVFGLQLGLLPTSGYSSGLSGALRTLTLPALTLGLIFAPLILRTLRAALIATMSSDFVEAARARGLSQNRVLFKHALRNSLVSGLTVVGLSLVLLVSSSVVIESVFGIPGLGDLLVSAVQARDFPVIQGLTVLMGTGVVLINLMTDLAYAIADPRVRL
jgi:peptide/nickel transport system permease protein